MIFSVWIITTSPFVSGIQFLTLKMSPIKEFKVKSGGNSNTSYYVFAIHIED